MSAHIHLYAVLIFVALYQLWAPLISASSSSWCITGCSACSHRNGCSAMHHMGVRAALGRSPCTPGWPLVEVAGIVIFWHFAEQAERENE